MIKKEFSKKEFIKKKLLMFVLFLGLGFVVWNFLKKNHPQKVIIKHIIKSKSYIGSYKLSGEIINKNEKSVWKGEFKVKKGNFTQTLKLLNGDYVFKFFIENQGDKIEKELKITIPPKEIQIIYNLN
jgi:hypothetical protein